TRWRLSLGMPIFRSIRAMSETNSGVAFAFEVPRGCVRFGAARGRRVRFVEKTILRAARRITIMRALSVAGLIALTFALSGKASSAGLSDALSVQATIATPSTSGPICSFAGSEDVSGVQWLQVRCARQGVQDFTQVIGWQTIMVSEDRR